MSFGAKVAVGSRSLDRARATAEALKAATGASFTPFATATADDLASGRLVIWTEALTFGMKGQCPIHGACVEVSEIQFLGEQLGYRALPRSGWSVDGNNRASRRQLRFS